VKNIVLTGFGEITLLDLDTIDLSNLNRQFLFKKKDVKQSKALVGVILHQLLLLFAICVSSANGWVVVSWHLAAGCHLSFSSGPSLRAVLHGYSATSCGSLDELLLSPSRTRSGGGGTCFQVNSLTNTFLTSGCSANSVWFQSQRSDYTYSRQHQGTAI
jgi:hypothetical protein